MNRRQQDTSPRRLSSLILKAKHVYRIRLGCAQEQREGDAAFLRLPHDTVGKCHCLGKWGRSRWANFKTTGELASFKGAPQREECHILSQVSNMSLFWNGSSFSGEPLGAYPAAHLLTCSVCFVWAKMSPASWLTVTLISSCSFPTTRRWLSWSNNWTPLTWEKASLSVNMLTEPLEH